MTYRNPSLNVPKIREEIYNMGLSQHKFAKKLGFCNSELVRILNAGRCSAFNAEVIATGLGLKVSDILLDEEPWTKKSKLRCLLDDGAFLPTRAHKYDAGLDLYARKDFEVPAHGGILHDTGVHVSIPKNYVGLITSKSSLMLQYITCRGTIDYGYTGSIKAVLFNHGDAPTVIRKGQKITQLVIVPVLLPELELVDSLEESERGSGGFGSTGAF